MANGHPIQDLHVQTQPHVILQHNISRRGDLLVADIDLQVVKAMLVGAEPAVGRDLHVLTMIVLPRNPLMLPISLDMAVIVDDDAAPLANLDDRASVDMYAIPQAHLAAVVVCIDDDIIVDEALWPDDQPWAVDLRSWRDIRVRREGRQYTPDLCRGRVAIQRDVCKAPPRVAPSWRALGTEQFPAAEHDPMSSSYYLPY